MLGKAPGSLRMALGAYGRELGAAFQIADDLLDATATAEQAGKATGKDAGAGKATLVSLLGLERARIQAERLVEQAHAGAGHFAQVMRWHVGGHAHGDAGGAIEQDVR